MARKTATSPDDDPVGRFEASLQELETIIARMESGDLPLEESLKLFERGVTLSKACRNSLATAELRVKKLMTAPEGDPGSTDDDAP